LSVRIMHDDGVVYASDVLRALTWLRDGLGADTPERVADVVVMAFGYRPRHPEDDQHTAELRTLIWELADAGVQVVASAGNEGSGEQTFPAAFAADPDPPATPVISVGATNPNETDAHYSNHGDWVTLQRVGTGVISTMPAVAGDEPPPPSPFPEPFGETVDPDDFTGFTGGFARWSGTSFAAAVFAGDCAQAILDGRPVPRS
ncbi:MAG TPA: S8 family serine peptidase, partial [Pilimelia sp.]|nr:S8 family serine peptidase [Pilimelia sp.]